MRRSIFDGEGREFCVTLNGTPLADVIWADEEEGRAEVFQHEWAITLRGERVRDPSEPLGYRTLTITGEIRISERLAAPPPPEQASRDELFGCSAYCCGNP